MQSVRNISGNYIYRIIYKVLKCCIFLLQIKVFDLIEQENVNVTKDQLAIILTLLEKEKLLELQEDEQKAQQQLKQTQK